MRRFFFGYTRCATCAWSALTFETGEGPRLDAIDEPAAQQRLRCNVDHERLAPIYETIARVKQDLPHDVALLGFCGAPWTVATYMIAGFGTPDQFPARIFAYRYPQAFAELIDLLVNASAEYLVRQFEAGVDAVQIFDTWAGVLPANEFHVVYRAVGTHCRSRAPARSGTRNHRFPPRRRNGARAIT